MRRFKHLFASALLGLAVLSVAASPVLAGDAKAPAKKPVATKKVKAPPKKKVVPVSAEHKKALAELYAGFKLAMTKDEVIGLLSKQLDERYADKIKATSDMATQDRLRKDKKKELSLITGSYLAFEGKKSGWDVSIIEEEFAHNTGESMLERWENKDGKNQRRFFFFHEGKLWKMFIAFDTKQLAPESRNFGYFSALLEQRYGTGKMDNNYVAWMTPEFEVRAVDKMAFYGALGLLIQDPKALAPIAAIRKANAPAAKGKDNIIEVIRQKGDASDNVNLEENNDAVNAIINGAK